MRVAIIGGGISGLATAFYVTRARPDWTVSLFEAAAHLGGTMWTHYREGFAFESGSNGFLTNKPDTLDLVRESGGEHLLMPSNDAARLRYIYTDRLHVLPENPPAFLKSKLLSWPGKLRVAGEIFTPARRDERDETLQSFGERRVGKEFTDVFLNAMCAGIYASTPERISVAAAFPLVVRLEREHGGLFRGMLARRKKSAGPGGILMSFTRGVGTYVEYLHQTLAATIHTGTPVTGLGRDDAGWQVQAGGETHRADRVVVSTPAYAAAELLRPLDAELGERLARIEYSPVAVVGLGYAHLQHPLNGFGLLTTASAGKQVLGVLWDSSIFPDRAPAGKQLLRLIIGGQRNPELARQDDAALLAIARRGVRETMGVDEEPAVTYVKRWDRGIPNYPVGHLANVDALFARLPALPGLHLTNNAYYGIGLNDCVAQARQCAERVVASTA